MPKLSHDELDLSMGTLTRNDVENLGLDLDRPLVERPQNLRRNPFRTEHYDKDEIDLRPSRTPRDIGLKEEISLLSEIMKFDLGRLLGSNEDQTREDNSISNGRRRAKPLPTTGFKRTVRLTEIDPGPTQKRVKTDNERQWSRYRKAIPFSFLTLSFLAYFYIIMRVPLGLDLPEILPIKASNKVLLLMFFLVLIATMIADMFWRKYVKRYYGLSGGIKNGGGPVF